MKKNLKIIRIIFTLILVSLLCLSCYLTIRRVVFNDQPAKVFGYASLVVVSGSMKNELNVNDIVIIHNQPEYAEGDIITFHKGRSLTTHRIIGIENGDYITKGDFNDIADKDAVSPEKVEGKVVFVIPKLGKISEFAQSTNGLIVIILIGFLILISPYVIESIQKRRLEAK